MNTQLKNNEIKKDSILKDSLFVTCEDRSTCKSYKPSHCESANDKEKKVSNEKRISLAQAERNITLLLEKLIGENTAKIARLIFSAEMESEFKVQISELEKDNQKRNANILRVMQEKFLGIESGSTFVEFKANVSELRQKAIAEYKERFEAEKLKDEKRKAIETQISALDAVRTIIGETAYTNGVNALRDQLTAI